MRFIIILAIIISASTLFSQSTFSLSSQVGPQVILLNGKKYNIDSTETKIITCYPKFDTLTFLTNYANSAIPIICNFKPDSSYYITRGYHRSLDVISKSKFTCDSLKYWEPEKDLDKIQNHFFEKPFLSIKTKQISNDSLYASHTDFLIDSEVNLINSKLWRLGVPKKDIFSTNITSIVFFKYDTTYIQEKNEFTAHIFGKRKIIILKAISLRLFDNQSFILTFDEQKRTIQIEYE